MRGGRGLCPEIAQCSKQQLFHHTPDLLSLEGEAADINLSGATGSTMPRFTVTGSSEGSYNRLTFVMLDATFLKLFKPL